MPFGTSSPRTTWRNVTITSARITASAPAITAPNFSASTCSPRAPMPRLVIVTPSCIAAMNRGGSAVIRRTASARRLPACSSSAMRVRLDVTRPYSAATKKAFRRISPARARSSKAKFMRGRRSPARAYWAARRRPSGSRRMLAEPPAGAPRYERVFYTPAMRAEYREEPCRSALNRVRGMPFAWSLNPYMGCAHRCTFCYVRAFERRADRPSDDRYGASIRVKTNVAEVLRAELARPSWQREPVAVGAATDPYQAAEGRYRLTRECIRALCDFRTGFGIITRGPLVVRDVDVLQAASLRAAVSISFSIPTLDERIWSTTEPGTAPPRARLRALEVLVRSGLKAGVAMAPLLPGLSDRPEL